MTTICYTAVQITLCFTLFIGLSRLAVLGSGCVNQAPNCTNFSGVHNILAPENVTVRTGENATFTSKSTCYSMKVYVNGCPVPFPNLSSDDGVTTLTYTAINVSLNDSGNSIDFIMLHCDGLSCYRTVYLTVLDPPIEPTNITIDTTCSGFNISFISSDATVVTVATSNGTIVYNGTVEPSINFVEINNIVANNEVYELKLKSYNEVGQSKYVIKNITTDHSIISFEISGISIEYVNNIPQATVTLDVDKDCILSMPRNLDVKCACLSGTRDNVILNRMFQFLLDLFNYKEICELTVEAGTLQINKSINTTAVRSLTINSYVTRDGYFFVSVTLQKGVTGIMMQVQYSNGTLFLNQPILRNSSSNYAGANNTRPLPNGTFYLTIYMLKSDEVSFDLSRPIKENIIITSLIKSPNVPNEEEHGFPTWAIILIVSVTVVTIIIVVVILVAAITILRWQHNRRGTLELNNPQAHEDRQPQEGRQFQEGEQPQEDEQLREQGGQPQEDEQLQEDGLPEVLQGDGQPQEDGQLQEGGECPPTQEYPQPVQEDSLVKGQKCTGGHDEPSELLSLSVQSFPVLTECPPPRSPNTFEEYKTFENLSSNSQHVYTPAITNTPSVTINDNSVSYSSTAGSDRPLLTEHVPVTSYRITASEEEKVNKPQKVKADSEPYEYVHI